MFGNKAKHALAAAQAENAQLKAQADTLQGELAATQARLAQLETQAQQSAMRQMLLDGVVGNLPRFGESLSGFRLSFSGLSEQLSDDAAMVHTAASESDANRAAFEKIAGNLHAMFERINAAGNSVEDLSRRAGEIGGILPSPAAKARLRNERWYPGDMVNASIGQGLWKVTPLQLVRAHGGIANGINSGIPVNEITLGGPKLLFVTLQDVFSNMGPTGPVKGGRHAPEDVTGDGKIAVKIGR